MNTLLVILLLAVGLGAYRLASDYVQLSMRSFASAERVWLDVSSSAARVLDLGIPQNVAKLVVMLTATAGCGCFVRGMLIGHYLPRRANKATQDNSLSGAFSDLESLDANVRNEVWTLLSQVMVYDSFRNPLQGWLFRRMLKNFVLAPAQANMVTKLEAQLTAISVLRRKATLA